MTTELNEKRAKDFSPAEYEAKLAELKRGAPPPMSTPVTPKHARDMTEAERAAKLDELKRLGR
jgi:ribosomal protein L29